MRRTVQVLVDVSSLPAFRVLHEVTAVEALLDLLRRPVAVSVVEREDPGPAKHFTLKRDAQAWLNEVAPAQLTGTYVAPAASRRTLEEFYVEWSGDQLWTQNTRRLEDRAVGECTFRSVTFGRLRRSHGEAYIKQLASKLVPTTVKTRAAYVRIVLRAVILDRRLAYDPLEGVKLPAARKTEHAMRVPSPAEVRALRAAIGPPWAAFVDVMAYAVSASVRLPSCRRRSARHHRAEARFGTRGAGP